MDIITISAHKFMYGSITMSFRWIALIEVSERIILNLKLMIGTQEQD